jgi:L-fucose isomerase-like protein
MLFESQVVNEQLLQKRFGQMIVPMDLDTVFSRIDAIDPRSAEVAEVVRQIADGVQMEDQTDEALVNIARYELAVRGIKDELGVQALSASCWTRVQERFHISTCSTFGRLNDQGIITACEVDLLGASTMWAMYNASLRQAIPDFIDWTDLHPTAPNVWLAWHCGNAAPSLREPRKRALLGRNERMIQWCPTCFGTLEFKLKSGPVTCARLVEYDGQFNMFIGSGEIVDLEPEIRGAYGWVKVKDVGEWEDKMIEAGIIHHGVLIHDPKVADALEMFCYFLDIQAVRG